MGKRDGLGDEWVVFGLVIIAGGVVGCIWHCPAARKALGTEDCEGASSTERKTNSNKVRLERAGRFSFLRVRY